MTDRNSWSLKSVFKVIDINDYKYFEMLIDCRLINQELSDGFFIRKYMGNPNTSFSTTQTSGFNLDERP